MVKRDDVGIDIKYTRSSLVQYKRVMPGDFVIHLRSFQGGLAFSELEGITSPAYTVIRFSNPSIQNNAYWGYLFNSFNFINQLKKITYGIRDGRSISFTGFKTLWLYAPKIREQSKIGELLKKLDATLDLRQRKLGELQKLKSAYLAEMFPVKGDCQPKRRFIGFSGAWEQHRLEEVGNVITGNTPSTKDVENWTTDKRSGHIWITPTDINSNVLSDSERYLSDKGWAQAKVVPKNSVLITSIASIGKNAINNIEAAFNQQINALVVQKNDPYFVLTLMNKEKHRFESLAGKTAAPIINKSNFSSFIVKLPSEAEQRHIGSFFQKLDFLIALNCNKLSKLQSLKSSLLNKLFV